MTPLAHSPPTADHHVNSCNAQTPRSESVAPRGARIRRLGSCRLAMAVLVLFQGDNLGFSYPVKVHGKAHLEGALALPWPYIIRPWRSNSLKCSQLAHAGTRFEFAISTRGASEWVVNTPTGLPD